MSRETIRSEWLALRTKLDKEALALKYPQVAVLELSRQYAQLEAATRSVVDELLSEWLLSQDADLRFEALALVADHKIVVALPALRQLQTRLEGSSDPGAPYERQRAQAIIRRLEELRAAPG